MKTISDYVRNFQKISRNYSESTKRNENPEEAKRLAMKQLGELQELVLEYKSTPNGAKMLEKFKNDLECSAQGDTV